MKKSIKFQVPLNMYTILVMQAESKKETLQEYVYRMMKAVSGYREEVGYNTRRKSLAEFEILPWYRRLQELRHKRKLSRKNIGILSDGDIAELKMFESMLRKELNKQYQKKYRKIKKVLASKPVL